MRIVYMGTPEFAVPPLKALLDSGSNVCLVVTQPDRRGNRGRIKSSAVKQFAISMGLETAQPERIKNDQEFKERLRQLAPDAIVVAAFGQILPQDVLDIPRYGCINVHGSLLPELRGASPMQHAILEGLETTGVTIMKMNAGLDTGDIISKVEVPVGDKNIEELAPELSEAGASLLIDTLKSIEDGSAVLTPQDDSKATYSHLIKKRDGETDFSGSAVEEIRKMRAYMDWPSLYSYLDGKMVKFFGAEVTEASEGDYGTIAEVGKDSFVIRCGEGALRITELQMQGKKRMKAGDFLRGHKLQKGEKFTRRD